MPPDTRPDLTSPEVIVRAVLQVKEPLMAWVRKRVLAKSSASEPSEEMVALIAAAIREVGADGFRASLKLMESCGWPADAELCRLIQLVCDQLPFARRLIVLEWVVANKVRFPVAVGETVKWRASGRVRTGIVFSINPYDASAVVRPTIGSALAGDMIRIVAEQVMKAE